MAVVEAGQLADGANMRDAYKRFFEALHITPDALFEFGLQEMIAVPHEKAEAEWEDLKRRIATGLPVAIRGYGRNGVNTTYFLILYSALLQHDAIFADKTNNAEPARLLRRTTGYAKSRRAGCELLANYQVSHVFGRTKNPFAFTAPWNVVYLPKIVDPFTGHEAPGDLSEKFRSLFRKHVYDRYRPMIEEFNELMQREAAAGRIERIIERLGKEIPVPRGFLSDVQSELAPIQVPIER